MAKLNIETTVSAPETINVPLVRADILDSSNVFRIFFEVFLSLAAVLIGVILSIKDPTTLHWVFFWVMAVSALVFLSLFIMYYRQAKRGG